VKISKSTLPVLALTFACASAPAEDPEPVAPEPIGAELLRVGCQGPFEELESVEPGCRWWSDDP
jgi:hypothetical protein